MTRSKPQSETVTTQRKSSTVARRLRYTRTRTSPGGTVSRRIAAANAKHTTKSAAASTSVRPKKNLVLSQDALTAIGCETHE